MPLGDAGPGEVEPLGGSRIPAQGGIDLLDGDLGVADHGHGMLFVSVPSCGVHGDEANARVLEDRPRARREVLEPRADRHHDIGVLGDGIRRRGPGDPDGTRVVGVVVDEGGFARNRLHHGDAAALGEVGERCHRIGIVNPAAGDDHRLGGAVQRRSCSGHVARVGARTTDVVDPGVEEPRRIVVGLGLDVLRECQEGGATRRRVEHDGERLRERLDDLLGTGDAIPVARHGLERVGHRDRRVAEVLDLLEHRVDDAVLERVAGDEQHREPVGVGHGRGRDHVRAAGADRRGGDHDASTAHRLPVGHGCKRHRLLVVSAPRRQPVLYRLEGLGERGHVAVAKDAEGACEQRHLFAVDDGVLCGQPLHDGLRHRQPNGLHCSLTSNGLSVDGRGGLWNVPTDFLVSRSRTTARPCSGSWLRSPRSTGWSCSSPGCAPDGTSALLP